MGRKVRILRMEKEDGKIEGEDGLIEGELFGKLIEVREGWLD